MKYINFNIINIKTKIKWKQGRFGNFPHLHPASFNFLNKTDLGIEKNKQAGSGWGHPSQTLILLSLIVSVAIHFPC